MLSKITRPLHGRGDRLEPIVVAGRWRRPLRHVRAAKAHGHTDVGLPQRRRIVHAVAQHRDDGAAGLQRGDDLQLVLRGDSAEHPRLANGRRKVGARHRIEVPAFNHPLVALEKAELAADRFGGEPLITGQHHRPESGATQPRDRGLHAGGRRIGETDESGEREIPQRTLRRLGHAAERHPQHAQAGPRQRVVGVPQRLARLIVKRQFARRRDQTGTSRKDVSGRTFRVCDKGTIDLMETGHQLLVTRERHNPRPDALNELRPIDTTLRGGQDAAPPIAPNAGCPVVNRPGRLA